jgi:hypothetical protein
MCHLSWLERKNLFQTFGQQSEGEIEQEIKEIRALLEEENSDKEEPQC